MTGAEIRRLRLNVALSQIELADALDLSHSYMAELEARGCGENLGKRITRFIEFVRAENEREFS